MFFRIYGAIALAIMVAVAISVSIYNYSYQKRLTEYSSGVLKGSLMLVAKGYQRQSNSRKARWLKLISQITGLNLNIKVNDLASKNTWKLTVVDEAIEAMFVNDAYQYQVRLDQIGEQQLRAIALLVINELALVKADERVLLMDEFRALFPFQMLIKREKETRYLFDNQQKHLFGSGNVVVFQRDNNQFITAKIGKGQVLELGPVAIFEKVTAELLVLLVLVNLLITSVTTYWLIRRLEKRINAVNQAVSEFGPSNTQISLSVKGGDIIANLSGKVNDMASRIQELLVHQREITQAVSHELRTPIARIKFRLELLNEELADLGLGQTEFIHEKLSGVERDLGQLEGLVDEILMLHKLDQDRKDYLESDFDLSPVVSTKIENFSLNYPNLKIELYSQGIPAVTANPKDMARLIDNLLGNACKHAKSEIKISLVDDLMFTRMSVEDDGKGISEEDREKIFKPFVQVKEERNEQVDGFGLGLAIVSRIANLNQLEIWVDESSMGGARFNVDCPKPPQPTVEVFAG